MAARSSTIYSAAISTRLRCNLDKLTTQNLFVCEGPHCSRKNLLEPCLSISLLNRFAVPASQPGFPEILHQYRKYICVNVLKNQAHRINIQQQVTAHA
jgi:hypothetical protein